MLKIVFVDHIVLMISKCELSPLTTLNHCLIEECCPMGPNISITLITPTSQLSVIANSLV